jgi:phospholipid/cholesterol/gamma-HCH transport system ATP-binding protein
VALIFELEQVSKNFEGQEVLKNVQLRVVEGTRVAIIGPSGKGKTTLLKLLAGLVDPSAGKVRIHGEDWTDLNGARRKAVLKDLGMLFQKNALFDSMSVGENVAFPLKETTELSESEIDRKVDFFLDAVGILHAKKLFPDEISGGMQKRLGIARALALNPKVIFYDDPTAGLDPITSKKIIELIKDLQAKNNSTVFAVTNDMNRAFQIADEIWMVVDNEVLVTGTVEETKRHKDPRVQQFILGQLVGPLTVMA